MTLSSDSYTAEELKRKLSEVPFDGDFGYHQLPSWLFDELLRFLHGVPGPGWRSPLDKPAHLPGEHHPCHRNTTGGEMKAIWKYPINPHNILQMPEGGRILSVQTQDNQPQMWVLVDPAAPKIGRAFTAVATGETFDPEGHTYIGTFQINNGGLVFHLFEVTPLYEQAYEAA